MLQKLKMKELNKSIAFRYLKKYGQYTQNENWLRWYSKVAPYKGKRTAEILLNYKDDKAKLLDLGCGIGLTLTTLGRYFPNSVGCDIVEEEVAASRELLKLLKIKSPVVLYDGKQLPFADASFDIVTSIEVIEHVANPDLMLKEIRRVLKPDGILHITTANKWWPIEPHYHLPLLSFLPKKIANLYLRLSKKGTSYDDINLPSYGEFYDMVNKFFKIDDITLDVIRNNKKYGLDKERGLLIPIIGWFLKTVSSWGKTAKFIEYILIRVSLGWLFVAKPKK